MPRAEADSQSTTVSSIMITPVGNQMTFEQTDFTVAAGSNITLTFVNTATSPAMAHNIVLLADDGKATSTPSAIT